MTKWKLVPVDPTPEMVVAGIDTPVIVTEDDKIDQHDDYKRVYASMLEAAPQPPELSDERILEIAAKAEAQWNAVADQYNQWRELDSDEITILTARAIEREILGSD
jgi:hypothetical protein